MSLASQNVRLNNGEIDTLVPSTPGAYRLRVNDVIAYVGRSDTDPNDRLKDYPNGKEWNTIRQDTPQLRKEPSTFDFAAFDEVVDAHDMECDWFHRHVETIVNEAHPDSPDGMDLKCRVCSGKG